MQKKRPEWTLLKSTFQKYRNNEPSLVIAGNGIGVFYGNRNLGGVHSGGRNVVNFVAVVFVVGYLHMTAAKGVVAQVFQIFL